MQHRANGSDFTRTKKLSFPLLIVLLLQKGVKSLQLLLNEMSMHLGVEPVSHSAFSQRRMQLKHTAFIELNEKAVVNVMYSDDDYQTYKGMRLLAIDGSKLMLPSTPSVIGEFGEIPYGFAKSETIGKHAYALASVMYDVLNRIAVDSHLGKAHDYEVDLALGHLKHTQEKDLLLCDRNYPSFRFIASLYQAKRDFVIRCSASSFKQARDLLKGKGADSLLCEIQPHSSKSLAIKQAGLPPKIPVRFVRVRLKTGQFEVLVTSLRDETLYLTADFKELYRLRWGIETFFALLKTRLGLENFTGKSAESVYQDFYATVYLTGIESILTESSQQFLSSKETRYPQQVNRAVSFNAIKNKVLDMLFNQTQDNDTLLIELERLFLTNPTCSRTHRLTPRSRSSARALLFYAQHSKKSCF